jgi:hypothetical protein
MTEIVNPTVERFLGEVKNHKLEIFHDGGLNRHIRLMQPGTFNQRFDLITWPGHLCICGDMGTWVFERAPDMFEFFRDSSGKGESLRIDPYYWGGKLQAADCVGRREGGYTEFNADLFEKHIKERYIEHVRENMRGMPVERRELLGEIEDLISFAHSGEGRDATLREATTLNLHGLDFEDIWESYSSFEMYRYHFIWCLYAIVWGVQKYDTWKARPLWRVAYERLVKMMRRARRHGAIALALIGEREVPEKQRKAAVKAERAAA